MSRRRAGGFFKVGQIDGRKGHQTPVAVMRRSLTADYGSRGLPGGPSSQWSGSRRETTPGDRTADESGFESGHRPPIRWALQKSRSSTGCNGISRLAWSPSPAPCRRRRRLNRVGNAFGPTPEIPILVQLTFDLNGPKRRGGSEPSQRWFQSAPRMDSGRPTSRTWSIS